MRRRRIHAPIATAPGLGWGDGRIPLQVLADLGDRRLNQSCTAADFSV